MIEKTKFLKCGQSKEFKICLKSNSFKICNKELNFDEIKIKKNEKLILFVLQLDQILLKTIDFFFSSLPKAKLCKYKTKYLGAKRNT